ncbi:MAG: hypothetical protein K6T91_05660 [Firmicutes bacterium]|nr:hypothetical protein [Bacillota bacterium]
MDTLNRVLFIIFSALVLVASAVGLMLAFGAITPEQVQSVVPYQQVVEFFRVNLLASSLITILLLVIVMALSFLWLRGQYAEALESVTGGQYEFSSEGPGRTLVNYNVLEKSIDYAIRQIPGVIDSRTKIYSARGGRLFAHSSLFARRDADIREIDRKIRNAINREWLDRLGNNVARHDITINIETTTERRVA